MTERGSVPEDVNPRDPGRGVPESDTREKPLVTSGLVTALEQPLDGFPVDQQPVGIAARACGC